MDMAEPSFFTCIVAKCAEKKNLYEVNVEGDSNPTAAAPPCSGLLKEDRSSRSRHA